MHVQNDTIENRHSNNLRKRNLIRTCNGSTMANKLFLDLASYNSNEAQELQSLFRDVVGEPKHTLLLLVLPNSWIGNCNSKEKEFD
jgi:hypothetical protein